MKRISIFLSLIFSISFLAQAGGIKKNEWNPGTIYLKEGNSLSGKIQYDLDKNIVVLKKNDKLKAFSVHNVDYFMFKDMKRRTVRKFYSMPYRLTDGQRRTMFFELVFNDNFALFNREKTVKRKQAAMTEQPHLIDKNDREHVKVFTYFVFTPEGKFKKIFTEESDLARKLSLNQQEKKNMRRFINDNKLDLKNRSDFIRVIYEFV